MTTTNSEQILLGICEGREDLLALGRQFNLDVEKSSEKCKNNANNTEATMAIFALEEMGLSEDEKIVFNKIDELGWSDEQATSFLKLMGGDSNDFDKC